ncbi:hypothetical protein TSUD_52310 [Trifolium subterraneum]|uniref:Uncharacterized protein n=1 Tax=Trifolium subterraneum TaxID=3900 RepID=A0A2Z6N3B2_TRISU|nr:hypothetical protein TSUD_52310 [Trifolium subterraneum]
MQLPETGAGNGRITELNEKMGAPGSGGTCGEWTLRCSSSSAFSGQTVRSKCFKIQSLIYEY